MKEERVWFENSRGMKLTGLLAMPDIENSPVIIVLHGLNAHKTYYNFINKLAEELPKNDFAVLRFDFNTHGESDNDWKNFTRSECSDDLKSAIEFVKTKKVDSSKIGIFATSMGAIPFVLENENITAAVLHNPFILPSLWQDWIGEHEEEIKQRGYIELTQKQTKKKLKYGLPMFEESMNTDATLTVKEVKCPTLILFGSKDVTSERQRRETYALFKCVKDLKIIEGAGHSTSTTEKQAAEITRLSLDWFKKYLK